MIGKIITGLAGRTVARSIGGTSAGPTGAMLGVALPVVIPAIARRLGPLGMIGAAVGGVLFTRWLERRSERRKTMEGLQPTAPEAVLASPAEPQLLEGELLKRSS